MQLPHLVSGNLACVSYVEAPASCVVRLFFTNQSERHNRYGAIGQFLKTNAAKHFASFEYIEQGILVDGHWHPILLMERVEGRLLRRWLEDHTDKKDGPSLSRMAETFRDLLGTLEKQQMAHGDLHDENIFVAPDGTLRLIDYDGMFVPALTGLRSLELGRPGYQHPNRSDADYDAHLDRFSGLLILVALRALAERPDLWARYDNGQNLLFETHDLAQPGTSRLIGELKSLKDPETRDLLDRLLGWSQRSQHYPVPNADWISDPRKQALTDFLSLQGSDPRSAARLWESAGLQNYPDAAPHRALYEATRTLVRQANALEEFRGLKSQKRLREARDLWHRERLDTFAPAGAEASDLAAIENRVRLDETRSRFIRLHAAGEETDALQVWESGALDSDGDPATIACRATVDYLRRRRDSVAANERAKQVGFYINRLSSGASADELVYLWEARGLDSLPEARPYRGSYERAKKETGT